MIFFYIVPEPSKAKHIPLQVPETVGRIWHNEKFYTKGSIF